MSSHFFISPIAMVITVVALIVIAVVGVMLKK